MGIGDMVDKAKSALGDQDANIDKAADAAKSVAPDQADGAIDAAAEQAKKVL